jgi:hypothetical protein
MPRAKPQFAICLRNDDSDDLEVRKVYRVLPDTKAAAEGYLRVVDESGRTICTRKSTLSSSRYLGRPSAYSRQPHGLTERLQATASMTRLG